MTVTTAAQQVNPPLPFTKDTIINQLRHQATNGPAYVQHSATKALAHLKGLYAEARYEARLAFETARAAVREAADHVADQASEQVLTGYERITELMNGADPTEEELGGFAKFVKKASDDEEDEEGSSTDDDQPP